MLQEEFAIIRASVSRANLHRYNQTSMAARSNARVCCRLFAEIAGSNAADVMDVSFL
jgi:hypothetical protein